MRDKLMKFMWGRYGIDSLGYAIVVVSLVMSFASSLFDIWFLMIPSYLLIILELYRMMSRNISARAMENKKFKTVIQPAKKWFKLQYNKLRDIKTHRYFACPNCKNNLRVPKGRGEITITCPVCKTKFDRRT